MTMPMSRGKNRFGSGGKANPTSLSAREIGPALLLGALDQHVHDLLGRQPAEALGQRIRGHHVHRLGDEVIARLGLLQDLAEQVAHLQHPGEPLEHRDELAVLPLRDLQIDDVVVEVVGPIARRHRLELAPGRVHQHGLQRADLRRDVNGHTTSYSGQRTKWPVALRARGPRSTFPGSAPVAFPSAITGTPFTRTQRIPSLS